MGGGGGGMAILLTSVDGIPYHTTFPTHKYMTTTSSIIFYERGCVGGCQWLAWGKIGTAGGWNCTENGYVVNSPLEDHSANPSFDLAATIILIPQNLDFKEIYAGKGEGLWAMSSA